jgi:putative ATP-binding cassette transporter
MGRPSWRGGELGYVFSAAQQQRLSFARMLLHRPDWIFLSEATNALDAAAQREMAELLVRNFRRQRSWPLVESGLFDGFFQRVLHVKAETASG